MLTPSVSLLNNPVSAGAEVRLQSAKIGFSQTLKEVNKAPDLYQEIVAMQRNLLSGKPLNVRELLVYQMKSGQFNLRIELLSKIAEGALSTVRKFQSAQ